MPTTFQVSNVKSEGKPLAQIPVSNSVHYLGGFKTESTGSNLANLTCSVDERYMKQGVWEINGFLRAIHLAFAQHLPLALSPDDVWLAIAQGFATHVNVHAEDLRKQFVSHESRVKLSVRRDGFVKGAENPWSEVFGEFSDQIGEHIGKKRDLLVNTFSTTGPVEKAASEVVLMGAMRAYFSYEMRTLCGIPEITLLGTVDDWKLVRTKAQNLVEFNCGAWVKGLDTVLTQFVNAAEGRPEIRFWESLCKFGGGSGGPYVSGAVNVFFPYLKHNRPNPSVLAWDKHGMAGGGPTPDQFPVGLTGVPFVWDYRGNEFDMTFLGGFVGVSQDPTSLQVRPAIGWSVMDEAKCAVCRSPEHHEMQHPCKLCGKPQERHPDLKCSWKDGSPGYEPA
jgi:hypothetical protein